MSCNCKSGKEQKLNNLNSKDHLEVGFNAYLDLKDKPVSEYDAGDISLIMNAFYSIYPNAKGEVTPQHAFNVLKTVYEQNYGK